MLELRSPTPWDKKNRTFGDCMTCMGTSWSGAETGIRRRFLVVPILKRPTIHRIGWLHAVAIGDVIPMSPTSPIASGSCVLKGTTHLGYEWPSCASIEDRKLRPSPKLASGLFH